MNARYWCTLLVCAGLAAAAALLGRPTRAPRASAAASSAPSRTGPAFSIPVDEPAAPPRFVHSDDRAVAIAGTHTTSVGRDGLTLAIPASNSRLTYEFVRATSGATTIASGRGGVPRMAGDDACIDRGPIVERFRLTPAGAEQFFDIRSAAAEDLAIECRVGTSLPFDAEASTPERLVFGGDEGFSISHAMVVDARGASLPLPLAYAAGLVTLRVPGEWLAQAAFPITVDPLIGVNFQIADQGGSPSFDSRQGDVAYNTTDGEYFVVWSQMVSPPSGGGPPLPPTSGVYGQRVNATTSALVGPIGGYAETFAVVAFVALIGAGFVRAAGAPRSPP